MNEDDEEKMNEEEIRNPLNPLQVQVQPTRNDRATMHVGERERESCEISSNLDAISRRRYKSFTTRWHENFNL